MNPSPRTSLQDLLQQLHAVSAAPFEQASPIPPELNHSPEFNALERDCVFTREWICVGREDELGEAGSYMTHDIAGVSVLIVRQKDRRITAFINTCAHRLACLVPDQSGTTKKFTCRYHAWSYALDGALISAPHMEMKRDFKKSDHKLVELMTALWEGFIYVTLSERTPASLNSALKPLQENIVGRYDMPCYKTILRETMSWNANWKNLIENFTESYHVPVAHGKTFAKHLKPIEDYVCGEDSYHYCYHHAPQKSETGSGAAHENNKRLTGVWRRMMVDFCIFPCHLVTLMPDYLWWISVQPQGTDQFKASWGVAVPPEILQDVPDEDYEHWLSGFRNYMDIANNEDKELVRALHLGSRSSRLPKGTYHPIERNLWQFNRYLARTCGAK